MTDDAIDWLALELELVEDGDLDLLELLDWIRHLDPPGHEEARALAIVAKGFLEAFGPVLGQIADALTNLARAMAPVFEDLARWIEEATTATLDRAAGGPGRARPWDPPPRTLTHRDLSATQAPSRPNPIAFRRKQP
jgi:hypothetical protein